MRFSDLVSLIIANLNRRKGRVLLTAIGVMIGTAAIVTLVSLGAGLQKAATESLWGISDLSSITVYPNYGSGEGKGIAVAVEGMEEQQTSNKRLCF